MLYATKIEYAAELRRQDLLAAAERDRLAAAADMRAPRAVCAGSVRRLLAIAAEVLRQIGTIGMSPARSLRPSSEATSGASGAQ